MTIVRAVAAPIMPLGAAAVAALEPTRWHVAGYHPQVATLVASLICCAFVRFWAAAKVEHYRWTVEVPVTVVTMVFTIAAVVTIDPNLITACFIGTGLAAFGEGLIRKAKKWADRWLGDEPPTIT